IGGLMMIAEGPVLGRWLRYRMLGRRAISDHWRRPKTSRVRLLSRLLVRLLTRLIQAGRRALGMLVRRSRRSSTGQALSRGGRDAARRRGGEHAATARDPPARPGPCRS